MPTHLHTLLFHADFQAKALEQVVTDFRKFTGRWNSETPFQELRSSLGLERTRGWCTRTVLRAAPCLFGLYRVVALR
jgi:hypothetical protein